MRIEARSAGLRLAVARTWLVLLLIATYRLGRCVVVFAGLTHWLGAPWASALVLLVVLLRWTVLLQIGAALTLVTLWHWPALLAVIAVAPRLVTILPGLIRTWGASRRHPRPRWSPVEEAS
jgi:hypothetical protein